jgi:hypothetical protein
MSRLPDRPITVRDARRGRAAAASGAATVETLCSNLRTTALAWTPELDRAALAWG